MKLCKACNGTMSDKLDSRNIFCDRKVCRKARHIIAKQRWRKINPHPYETYDERLNWICNCPEWWVVPAKFNLCSGCGASPRRRWVKKKRIFVPERDAVLMSVFYDAYIKKNELKNIK